jgi:hypothetical protein
MIRFEPLTGALAAHERAKYQETYSVTIRECPFGEGWHVLFIDIRYRDILGWWWRHCVIIKPGGQAALTHSIRHNLSMGVAHKIAPPSWETFYVETQEQ